MRIKTVVFYMKGVCAWAIPYFSALGAGIVPYQDWPGWWVFMLIQIPAMTAGFSGLVSWASKSYGNFVDSDAPPVTK